MNGFDTCPVDPGENLKGIIYPVLLGLFVLLPAISGYAQEQESEIIAEAKEKCKEWFDNKAKSGKSFIKEAFVDEVDKCILPKFGTLLVEKDYKQTRTEGLKILQQCNTEYPKQFDQYKDCVFDRIEKFTENINIPCGNEAYTDWVACRSEVANGIAVRLADDYAAQMPVKRKAEDLFANIGAIIVSLLPKIAVALLALFIINIIFKWILR